MKIRLDFDGKTFELEREPMPPERFNALCKLAGAAIGGGVLLGLVYMLDVWGLVWSLAGLVAAGGYKLIRCGLID